MEVGVKQKKTEIAKDEALLLDAVEAAGAALASALHAGGPRRDERLAVKTRGSRRRGHRRDALPRPLAEDVLRPLLLGVGIGVAFGLMQRSRPNETSTRSRAVAGDLQALLHAAIHALALGAELTVRAADLLSRKLLQTRKEPGVDVTLAP